MHPGASSKIEANSLCIDRGSAANLPGSAMCDMVRCLAAA